MRNEIHEKIVIVEDDAGIVKFLKTTLTAAGYEPIIAETGEQALALISSHCPDCVLLDLGLPDMDGNTIIEQLRSWSRMPIVVSRRETVAPSSTQRTISGASRRPEMPVPAMASAFMTANTGTSSRCAACACRSIQSMFCPRR